MNETITSQFRVVSPGTDTRGRILVVDDDSMSRRLLVTFLTKAGYVVVAAASADEAVEIVGRDGIETFSCVVTDYRMPEKDGLWLLNWLSGKDSHLTSIMVTAEGEKKLVMDSLRQGACDFLDKPVAPAALSAAVAKASRLTLEHRSQAKAESEVKAIGRIQQLMVGSMLPKCGLAIDLCYHPSHEAGGDFISVYPLGNEQFLVLVTDVSGHDLRAAYYSAYFQGFVRGMLEKNVPIAEVLERFNTHLIEDLARQADVEGFGGVQTSVAACALMLNRETGKVDSLSRGFPMPLYFDGYSTFETLGDTPSPPLGWFPDVGGQVTQIVAKRSGCLYLWTDGLEDLACRFGVSSLTVAYALDWHQQLGLRPEWMKEAADDILMAIIRLKPRTPYPQGFMPVFFMKYAGNEYHRIDELQETWERCLRFAIPPLTDDRIFDVLLCCREVAINAMKHGCRGKEDEFCSFLICCDADAQVVRVVVSDPGPGHDFDWAKHKVKTEQVLIDEHRGLMLLHMMANQLNVSRRGAHVELEFNFVSPLAA